MLPANRALNACNHSPSESTSWRLSSLRTGRRLNGDAAAPKHGEIAMPEASSAGRDVS